MADDSNKRIAQNTMYLYIRMLLTMLISLYTSRIVLSVLGVSDFGLYNVVGGVISMFSMFSGTLAGGTQRFLTYAIGKNDFQELRNVFSISLGLHFAVSGILLILAETIGIWFLYTQLSVPEGRMIASLWVYQFSIIAFIISLIQIPFMSSLIAHEKMNIYAYMSIYDVVMKLLIVFLIQWLAYDKLILYGFLIMLVNVTSILIYISYCIKKFPECTLRVLWDSKIGKDILAFSGWNIFGNSIGFLSGQGINILLNIFFGTVVNAARGIANTVNTCIVNFVSNFQTAVNPQIVKLYAAKEYDKFYSLVVNNARAVAYLYLFLAIPAFLEVDFCLTLWLGKYPEYTTTFVRIILIQSAFQTINRPFVTMVHASGQMKWPNLTAGVTLMMMFPISYIALKMGCSPISVYIICAIIWSFDNIWDIYWPHHYTGIPVSLVLRKVYANVIIGAIIMFIVPYIVSSVMEKGWLRFLCVGLTSTCTSVIVIYVWGMTKGMKHLVLHKLKLKK